MDAKRAPCVDNLISLNEPCKSHLQFLADARIVETAGFRLSKICPAFEQNNQISELSDCMTLTSCFPTWHSLFSTIQTQLAPFTGSEIVAMAKSILIFSGVLLGASVGWYLDFAVIGAVVGVTCGIWCAITMQLLDLPSKPTRSKPGLVQTPEQGLVKQWTKDEKQTPSTQ